MLSKAFDNSSRIKKVIFFLSMAFSIRSVRWIFEVSVEFSFLFPLWWVHSRLLSVTEALNWFKTIFSHTLEVTASSDSGRLSDATSWSPSLRRGMTSARFHAVGKVDVLREQLIITVNGPRITGIEFSDLALTLSGTGDLFRGNDKIIRLTSSQDKDLKLKRSSLEKLRETKKEGHCSWCGLQ